jgi:hypothetical protein
MTDPHATSTRRPNRLAREKSPYLLQHALNPVDWYPWGEEAFEKARREDKPIFLSIGYSTCHWCHVMERESFEDEAVAAVLNQDFVPIKVDREERPDVDRVHMSAMQALGLGGGWPLNVFLTPRLEPFYGGTYFPPRARMGRIGMRELLPRVREAWATQREQLTETGTRVLEALASLAAPDAGTAEREPLLEAAAASLERAYDPDHGGFGGAPKFPSTGNLAFLMRWWWSDPGRHREGLGMVLGQLEAMRAGGIHDHLGGGFHRYSTDREWLVPHFEKMLYDQALIAWAYLEAAQADDDPRWPATARAILDYVARDLTGPEGAFFSAEDADSEGEEGRFYVWRPAEIEALLGAEDAALFAEVHGVTEDGNFEHRTSILSEARRPAEVARERGIPAEEAESRLARARAALLAARSRRVRPQLDDKVITAWNGLMISAFARGARVLGDDALRARAERAATFAWARLRDPASGVLRRRWRQGEAAGEGQLDDHAYLALGLLDLYQAGHDPVWLARAVETVDRLIGRFHDPEHGGFWESPAGDPNLRVRLKDDFDGAELAGNSIAAWLTLALGQLLGREDWLAVARGTLDAYARRLRHAPLAMPQMLVAMDLELAAPRQVVIVGRRGAEDTRALTRVFDRRLRPHDALLVVDPAAPGPLADLAPFAASLPMREGRATGYLCVDRACRLPVTDPIAFEAQLDERPARRDVPEEDR